MILAALVVSAVMDVAPRPRTGMGVLSARVVAAMSEPEAQSPAAVSPFLVFSPSPSPAVPPAAYGYECFAWERHEIQVACPPETPGPCFGTSDPVIQGCIVMANPDPAYIWQGVTTDPAPGQVVFGCVRAVTFTGRYSDCVGGGDM